MNKNLATFFIKKIQEQTLHYKEITYWNYKDFINN